MYIRELSNPEYDNFAKNYPYGSLYQSCEYSFVMNNNGFETMFLGMIDDGNNIVAATTLIIEKQAGFKYAYAPRGFLIDYNDYNLLETFTSLIKKYVSKKDIIAIKLSPLIVRNTYNVKTGQIEHNPNYDTIFNNLNKLGYFHFGYNNMFEAIKPRYEALISIDKPYYEVFSNLKKNYRTKIRSAAKCGVKIYRGDEKDLPYLYMNSSKDHKEDLKYYNDCFYFFKNTNRIEFFYAKIDTEVYLRYIQSQYHKYEQLSYQINNSILENNSANKEKLISKKIKIDKLFNKYKNELVEATKYIREYPDGIIAASALVIKYRDEAYLIIDNLDKKYARINAKQLLIWKLLEKYSNNGYKTFNLGGFTNPNMANNPYKKLNTYKMNYNPIINEYLGDLELVTNKALYFVFKKSAPFINILKK